MREAIGKSKAKSASQSTKFLFVDRSGQWCLQCSSIHLSQYNMVFSGEEGFKGGASAPSLEREVSGMSFLAAI